MEYQIIIQNSKGETKIEPFTKPSVAIGKSLDNDIVLPQQGVSRRHAKLYREASRIFIEDLNSTNGTFVNEVQIQGRTEVQPGDTIRIGTFSIAVRPLEEKQIRSASGKIPRVRRTASGSIERDLRVVPGGEGRKGEPRFAHYSHQELIKEIHARLLEIMDLRRMSFDKIGDEDLREKTKATIINIIDDMKEEIPPSVSRPELLKDVLNEALGLGPLEDLIADPTITEIMVNRADRIYIERGGKIVLCDKTFSSDNAVLQVIERIVAPIGRRIDESSPMVDARLKNGSRVNAIIPPLALNGPTITIRKFAAKPITVEDLIRFGSITRDMAEFFKVCVKFRKNILVSGGTGSGKTTLLNVLSAFIPEEERIITIEDAAELQLPQDHVVSLETRPPNIEGKGAIPIRDLVRNSLRMRPDRIVVGECRGGEALDMLQAMNTGHDGSLTTLHANSPRDALLRLETMVLMAGMELPLPAIRQQISSAVDIIIQQTRFSCGTRKVTQVSEIIGMEGEIITMQDLFIFKQYGYDANGKVMGELVPTGMIPKFYDEMRERKIPVNTDIFTAKVPLKGGRR